MGLIPAPGAHGGDGAQIAAALGLRPDEVLDLSQSLNPVATDPRIIVEAHLDALARYPDPNPARLALAQAMGVDPDRLLLTNGGAEAITLVAAELGGSVHEPEFSLYPRGNGPVWRSNPHTPTGLLAGADERAGVWDEAFYPLATGRWTRGDTNAVVVGSLTKLLACPGLRVGYVLADLATIDACRRRQPTWSLNGLAAAALPEMLSSLDLAREHATMCALRDQLRAVFEHHGLAVLPSDANWLLVKHAGLRDALAREAIAVRDCANFGLAGLARIAVPDDAGRARLIQALDRLHGWIDRSRQHVEGSA